jgi:hypothetical protein
MCLNETCSTMRVGKDLSNRFATQSGLKQRDALSLFVFQLCFGIRH